MAEKSFDLVAHKHSNSKGTEMILRAEEVKLSSAEEHASSSSHQQCYLLEDTVETSSKLWGELSTDFCTQLKGNSSNMTLSH